MNSLIKTTLPSLTLIILLFSVLTACSAPGQTQQVDINDPIILIKASRAGEGAALLEFACLNQEDCPDSLEIASGQDSTPNKPGMTRMGGLYISFYNRGEIVFVDSAQPSVESQKIDPELKNFLPISLLYTGEKVIVASLNTLWIVREEEVSHTVIELADKAKGDLSVGLGGLIQGANGAIHAFEFSPQIQNGQVYAHVFTLDAHSEIVTSTLLRVFAPDREERRNLQIVSVADDLSRVYYTFHVEQPGEKDLQKLGMSDTQTGEELALYASQRSDRCLPAQGYRQHGDALFVATGSGGPLLLRLNDLTPIIDFTTLQTDFPVLHIAPFGEFFLAGTANEVLVLSERGKILATYPAPMEFFGKQYTFVEQLEK